MAMRNTEFISTTATLDCKSVLQTLERGEGKATAQNNALAKLWKMIFPYLEGEQVSERVRWMPAHKKEEDAEKWKDSRGQPLTTHDVRANERVDSLAKKAVEEHRVPERERNRVKWKTIELKRVVLSIGIATRCANDPDEYGGRDTVRNEGVRRRTQMSTRGRQLHVRTPAVGGHELQRRGGRWRCFVCGKSASSWCNIAAGKCSGSRAMKWAQVARRTMRGGDKGGTDGAGHVRMLSDETIWCNRCGAVATHHAVGMALPCRGRPKPGGMEHNLRLLRRGINPQTNVPFREGPYAEPGANRTACGGHWGAEVWGTGREMVGVKGPGVTEAGRRLAELRERVKKKATRSGSNEGQEARSAAELSTAGGAGAGSSGAEQSRAGRCRKEYEEEVKRRRKEGVSEERKEEEVVRSAGEDNRRRRGGDEAAAKWRRSAEENKRRGGGGEEADAKRRRRW
jgi:hypothetical protein